MFAISARVGKGETGPFPLANMFLTDVRPGLCRAQESEHLPSAAAGRPQMVLRETCQPARLLVKAMKTRGKQCVISETTCKTVPIC